MGRVAEATSVAEARVAVSEGVALGGLSSLAKRDSDGTNAWPEIGLPFVLSWIFGNSKIPNLVEPPSIQWNL